MEVAEGLELGLVGLLDIEDCTDSGSLGWDRVGTLTLVDSWPTLLAVGTSMSIEDRVKQLHDRAVRELVEAHKQRRDEPLALAVRFDLADTQDVHLLEALDEFPGGDDDELLTIEFEPSPQLLILGKLHLTLGSPAQLEAAIRKGDATIERFRNGTVVHDDGSQRVTELRRALDL